MAEQDSQSKETQENKEEEQVKDVQSQTEEENADIRLEKFKKQRDEERAKNEELQTKLQELEERVNSMNNNSNSSDDDVIFTDEEEQVLRRAEKYFEKKGFVRKQDLEHVEKLTKRAEIMTQLQNKYNNSDYPDFDPSEVVTHAQKKGFGDNYESAYFDMHRNAIISVEAKKGVQTVDSEKPTGTAASQPTPTKEDIENMSPDEFAEFKKNFKKTVTSR